MVFAWQAFLIAWPVGLIVTAVAFRLTRHVLPSRRRLFLSFLLAATLTPSIVVHPHSPGIVPAVHVLVVAPFAPMYGWTYSLLFGALPILVVWTAIGLIWLAAGAGHPQKS
jgi:hypothetical protein